MTHAWEIPNAPQPPKSGVGVLVASVVILLVIIILVSAVSNASPVRIRWDANPEPGVTEYRIYRIAGQERTLIGTSSAVRTTVEASPGDVLAVTAWNGVESEMSDPLTVPVERVKVKLWRSTDLKTKIPVAEFYFDIRDKEFFSLTVETP